jgi:ankyrin repeat protein
MNVAKKSGEYANLTVTVLKKELAKRGVDNCGVKKDLIVRLVAFDVGQASRRVVLKREGSITVKTPDKLNLICPITQDVFDNPVVAFDGFTYSKSAIEEWFSNCFENPVSPLTREVISRVVYRNRFVEDAVKIYRTDQGFKLIELIERLSKEDVFVRITDMLEQASVDLETRRLRDRRTPILIAAEFKHIKLINLLIGYGADYNATDADGKNIVGITNLDLSTLADLDTVPSETDAYRALMGENSAYVAAEVRRERVVNSNVGNDEWVDAHIEYYDASLSGVQARTVVRDALVKTFVIPVSYNSQVRNIIRIFRTTESEVLDTVVRNDNVDAACVLLRSGDFDYRRGLLNAVQSPTMVHLLLSGNGIRRLNVRNNYARSPIREALRMSTRILYNVVEAILMYSPKVEDVEIALAHANYLRGWFELNRPADSNGKAEISRVISLFRRHLISHRTYDAVNATSGHSYENTLMFAIEEDDLNNTRILARNVGFRSSVGDTALHYATRLPLKNVEIIHTLLQSSVGLSILNVTSNIGETPVTALQYVIEAGSMIHLRAILMYRPNLFTVESTVLFDVLKYNESSSNLQMIDLILQSIDGLSILNVTNRDGETLILKAVTSSNLMVVAKLMRYGPDQSILNTQEQSPRDVAHDQLILKRARGGSTVQIERILIALDGGGNVEMQRLQRRNNLT